MMTDQERDNVLKGLAAGLKALEDLPARVDALATDVHRRLDGIDARLDGIDKSIDVLRNDLKDAFNDALAHTGTVSLNQVRLRLVTDDDD